MARDLATRGIRVNAIAPGVIATTFHDATPPERMEAMRKAVAMGHPDVAEAAVIGLPHPKWSERPLLIVVPKEGRSPTKQSLIEFLSQRMAKWMLPDDVVFTEELPHTATGKLLKTKLRETYRDHRLLAE